MTMKVIQHYEVGAGGVASIVLSNIDQTYTDLKLVLSSRATGSNATGDLFFKFNNSTASFSYRHLYGNGSTASSYGQSGNYSGWTSGGGNTANTYGSAEWYITNYASTTQYKSISCDNISENNATTAYQSINAQLWSSNSALTNIEIYMSNGNFAQYSSATLFGILAGSDGTTTVS